MTTHLMSVEIQRSNGTGMFVFLDNESITTRQYLRRIVHDDVTAIGATYNDACSFLTHLHAMAAPCYVMESEIFDIIHHLRISWRGGGERKEIAWYKPAL